MRSSRPGCASCTTSPAGSSSTGCPDTAPPAPPGSGRRHRAAPPAAADRFVARLAHHRAAGSDPPDDRVSASSATPAGRSEAGRPTRPSGCSARRTTTPPRRTSRSAATADLGLALVAVDRDAAQTLMQAAIEARGCRRATSRPGLVGLIDAARRSGTLGGEAGALIDGLLRWSESAVAMDLLDRARSSPRTSPAAAAQAGRRPCAAGAGGVTWRWSWSGPGASSASTSAACWPPTSRPWLWAAGDTRALVDAAHHQATAAGLAGDRRGAAGARRAGHGPAGDEPATTRMLVGYHLAVAVTEGRDRRLLLWRRSPGGTPAPSWRWRAGWRRGACSRTAAIPMPWPPRCGRPPRWPPATGARRTWWRALATGIEPLAAGDAWPHAVGLLAVLAVGWATPRRPPRSGRSSPRSPASTARWATPATSVRSSCTWRGSPW